VLERIAILLGITLANHRAHAALVERVKELTCLHGIARAVSRSDAPLASILRDVVALLPPAWQYPASAHARIVLDDATYATPGFQASEVRLEAPIVVRGQPRGSVEVAYVHPCPPADDGPFLAEERTLLQTVARELASLVERRTVEEERGRLQEQLRHADRLATIGQLSAGVAHELNEPLATALGFAQLCRKQRDLPSQVVTDLDRIIAAALHAREIIKKLMLFARERPQAREMVSLNRIVEEGLLFLESGAGKGGIEIRRAVAADLPEVLADPNQLHQVLVNLVVNAMQAMPRGGPLTIETYAQGAEVVLAVEDHGVGMDPQVVRRIFEPFFTTKDVGEGTGLGLAVVHGIVTAHGGTIRVQSRPGEGSRFEVHLPIEPPQGPGPSGADDDDWE
jgi:signal transduction histidine kinase